MQKVNYQRMLDGELDALAAQGKVPSLLLHVCCAPCSSYVLEYLSKHFDITVFYYNPNITDRGEYEKRASELRRLLDETPGGSKIGFALGEYNPDAFYNAAEGLEDCPEGGERCFRCYRLRIFEAGKYAAAHGFEYFTTTLSVSPHKNAEKLNDIGAQAESELSVRYLYSDFKKRGGYQRSIELSKAHSLYRQSYCGCEFSRLQAQRAGRL